ncbi:trypsin-like serine protease [Leptobacterium flavescens]|uniref:Trypsin-like serine protease n=1 Tax=Leptobacterium flavescens TaxID=472055 RepID=A0A6P0UHV0_9FLAO|nr:trypsin-like peptidase domain-containing protein [Leptobacterium flavescens]NER12855.1 trypsin-like serine protease [Leptobacterium flavescens]
MKTFIRITILSLCAFLLALSAYGQEQHAVKKIRPKPINLTPQEKVTVSLYEKVIPTVVTIFTSSEVITNKGPAAREGLGSGVLISGECHILTAAHVVDGSSKVMVKTYDGKLREAQLLFSEKNADIALLKLIEPDHTLAHATLGDSDYLAIGQNVYAVGSPYGLENSFSSGIVSSFRSFDRLYDGTVNVEFIQTDAAINSGNSGGPLFNSKGEVVGIASRILSVSGGFQGIGLAVSINTAKQLLAFEERPWIGVDSVFLGRDVLQKIFQINAPGALVVQSIAKGSPADKAGLKAGYIPAKLGDREILLGGDIILDFAEQETCHVQCLLESHKNVQHSDTIKIKFLRNGKLQEVAIDVSETRRNFLKN